VSYYPRTFWPIVANIGLLPVLDGADGDVVFVTTVRSPWQYVTAGSSFIVDHITVEATASGGASRWVRDVSYSDPTWRTFISDVYIDSVSGDDENQGIYTSSPSSPLALKTWQELARRWGTELPVTATQAAGPSQYEVNVHVLNPIVAPDFVTLQWVNGVDTYVIIQGENTSLLHAGTLDVSTGFTPWNPSSGGGGTPCIIKDSTGTLDWSPYIGKRIFFATVGSWAIVLKNLGSGQARISPPQLVDPTTFSPEPSNVFPANGATYRIEDPVHVLVGTIDMSSAVWSANSNLGPFTGLNIIDLTLFGDLEVGTPSIFPNVLSGPWFNITFWRCIFEAQLQAPVSQVNVIFTACKAWGIFALPLFSSQSSGFSWFGGAFVRSDSNPVEVLVNGYGTGDQGFLDWYTHVQGGSVYCSSGADIRAIAIFDAVTSVLNPDGDAIRIGAADHHTIPGQGVQFLDRSSVPIFGNGNSGYGVKFAGNTVTIIETTGTAPNVTGTLGDFALGVSGQTRYFNESSGVYSTATITSSWANFVEAQPSGFGGDMHNLTRNIHVIQTDSD
jgi:hypothetical protein